MIADNGVHCLLGECAMPEQSENKAKKTDTIDKAKQQPTTKPGEAELSEQDLSKVAGGIRKAGGNPLD